MPKSRKQTYRKKSNLKNVVLSFVMIPILALTIFVALQPQRIQQFAEGFSAPPIFGCLHTGEADPTLCGTRMGKEGASVLKVNGQKYVGQNVYYNDTLSGAFTYKNTGDLPINIANYGMAAGSLKQYYIATFEPLEGAATLRPGDTLTSKESKYTFGTGDPSEGWVVGPGITNTEGQPLPITESTNLRLNSACTALRVKTLTEKDKSNIKALCSKDPKNILCTSRQYCEIFKGGQCSGPVLGEPRENQQCDEYIVLDQKEQDILEQLCKASPDTDACKDFCKRAIGSKICPEKLLWFDKDGKQVFPQPAKYMASANAPAVAGANTVLGDTNDTTVANAPGQSCRVLQDICDGGSNCVANPGESVGTCTGAPQTPAVPKVNPFKPMPKGTAPGQSMDPRSYVGYKPSCPSHRANEIGQCCASDFPLINGCCQPGCFVWHSAPESRDNTSRFRNKNGVPCAEETVLKFGYCQPSQVPAGKKPLGGESEIPRDTNKIYPPNYKASPPDTGQGPVNPGSGGGSNPPGVANPGGIKPGQSSTCGYAWTDTDPKKAEKMACCRSKCESGACEWDTFAGQPNSDLRCAPKEEPVKDEPVLEPGADPKCGSKGFIGPDNPDSLLCCTQRCKNKACTVSGITNVYICK